MFYKTDLINVNIKYPEQFKNVIRLKFYFDRKKEINLINR